MHVKRVITISEVLHGGISTYKCKGQRQEKSGAGGGVQEKVRERVGDRNARGRRDNHSYCKRTHIYRDRYR